MTYLYSLYMYILSTFYLKKNGSGRGHRQISTYRMGYEIKKISTSLLSVEGGEGQGGDAIFTKKNLNLKC